MLAIGRINSVVGAFMPADNNMKEIVVKQYGANHQIES